MCKLNWKLLAGTILLCLLPGLGRTQTTDASSPPRGLTAPPPSAGHFGSSPYTPPDADDITFVVDRDSGLDTPCTFRAGGPLRFSIGVTRYVGETNADGTLKDAARLVANGVVSATAKLALPGFDVDYDAVVPPPYQPERDRLLFNGHPVEFLRGLNDAWVLNSFVIPIEQVRFPARGAAGKPPEPARNEIVIEIDTANSEQLWCTAVDWAALSLKALSPLVLVHGNNSDGGFFERRGFLDALRRQGIPFDNSISMPTDTVAAHSALLDTLLPPIVASFGVDSVHLVAHSKGGLDLRDYLATYQPAHDAQFKVLSLSTLGSPHDGSVLADLKLAYDAAAVVTSHIDFSGFPFFTETVAKATTADAGLPNLSTGFAATFNAANLPKLGAQIAFNTVAGDADTNGNGEIDLDPDEYRALRDESPQLTAIHNSFGGHFKSRKAVDTVYQILRNSSGVSLAYSVKKDLLGRKYTVATITSIATTSALGNDTLVAIPSAQGAGGLAPRVGHSQIFNGAFGRNHANIADAGVAVVVLPWLFDIERRSGDLR